MTHQIKPGDVFRWKYKDETLDRGQYTYWCKSRIAIADEKKLSDTYWSSASDVSFWTLKEAQEKLDLEFLGNFSDLEKISAYEAEYYDSKDIVDIRHSNSMGQEVYRRKGTTRSRRKMLELATHYLEKWEAEKRHVERSLEEVKMTHALIEGGALIEHISLRKPS